MVECGRGVGMGGLVVGVDDQLRDALGPAVGALEPQDPDRIDELGNGAGGDARPERLVGLQDAAERAERRRRAGGTASGTA